MCTIFWLENLKVRDHLECVGLGEGNIRMVLREAEWKGVDWIHLAQDRNQWQACKHGNEPSASIKVEEFLD
jgi:hypothetical protein